MAITKTAKNKYKIRIYLGEEDGKQKYLQETFHGTRDQAEARKVEIKNQLDGGTYCEPSKQRLADFLDEWEEITLKARVSERTFYDYQDRLRLYIRPTLGAVKLKELRPEQIQKVLNDMTARGLSARVVRYTFTILKNALGQAVEWQKIRMNPADRVTLPKQTRQEMKVLNRDQVDQFLKAAAGSKWQAFFSLLLASGMRPGEALALKWPDIDFTNKRIVINRSLVRKRNGAGGWTLEAPKTNNGRRSIPLPAGTIRDLKEHKNRQKVLTLDGFVFANEKGEPGHEANITNRHFKPLLKKAGLPDIRLYDLRHTCATLLLGAGVNPKIVSERLGHADISLTLNTYSHVLPDMQEAATEKLEGIFK